ncbi:MAG: hypothetical protein H7070_04060 [Saprospiraceae bacterium]|nr:hypothetical protein [Pyrinomonadaceae bacterium]
MKPRDFFEVAVRVVGLFALLWGLWDLVNAVLFYTDYFRNPDMSFRFYLIYGWVNIIIGLLFIRAPWLLVDFAYANKDIDDESVNENKAAENNP